jgi:hypothetical protein
VSMYNNLKFYKQYFLLLNMRHILNFILTFILYLLGSTLIYAAIPAPITFTQICLVTLGVCVIIIADALLG